MTAIDTGLAGIRLLAPDAELVYDGPARTPEWFTTRRSGITATDVAAIVAPDQYSTALHVWLDKRGEAPKRPDNHFAEAGIRLEPVIAQWWADDNATDVHPIGVLARAAEPWMRCSPDRTVATCPDGAGPCGLEVKSRNAYVAGKWKEDVPDDVLAQVSWTMAVTGWSHMHVAALIGGNTPMWHRVDRDAGLEHYLAAEAARVWAAHLDGVPPQVDPGDAVSRLLEALYPHRAGDRVVDPVEAAEVYARYAEGLALEKAGKSLKDEARNWAIQRLDDAEELHVPDGRPLATFRAQESTGMPVEQLRRLELEDPQLHARLVREEYVTTTTTRVLRWTKKVGQSLG